MASLPGLQLCDDATPRPSKRVKREDVPRDEIAEIEAEFDDEDFYGTSQHVGSPINISSEPPKRSYDSFIESNGPPSVAKPSEVPGLTYASSTAFQSRLVSQAGPEHISKGVQQDDEDDLLDDFYGDDKNEGDTTHSRSEGQEAALRPDPGVDPDTGTDKHETEPPEHLGAQRENGTPGNQMLDAPPADSTLVKSKDSHEAEDGKLHQIVSSEQDSAVIEVAEAAKGESNAEWRFDSSDAESSEDLSDTSSSSDSSSDEDEDSDAEEGLLDRDATAKQLLEMLGNEDEEGPASSVPLKTANEVYEDILPKPEISITPEMQITEIGKVDRIVGNLVLIAANTSGDFRVLEAGSALCLADRTVIGAVMETMGKVQKPMYSMGVANVKEIQDAGIEPGTKVYYVNDHSTFVFTHTLKAKKGTDASNLFDEEAGVEEVEFSDDEREAEYKRELKNRKKTQKSDRPLSQEATQEAPAKRVHPDSHIQQPVSKPISYDEEEEGEEMYTPLRRPDNLHEMMTFREPIENRSKRGRLFPRGGGRGGHGGHGGVNDRGRGGRGGSHGSGRGHHFDRNTQRGGKHRGGRGGSPGFKNRRTQSPKQKPQNSPRPQDPRLRRGSHGDRPPPPPPAQPRYPNSQSTNTPAVVTNDFPAPPSTGYNNNAYANNQAQLPAVNPLALLQMLPQIAQANPALLAQLPAMLTQQQQSQPQQQQQHTQQLHQPAQHHAPSQQPHNNQYSHYTQAPTQQQYPPYYPQPQQTQASYTSTLR